MSRSDGCDRLNIHNMETASAGRRARDSPHWPVRKREGSALRSSVVHWWFHSIEPFEAGAWRGDGRPTTML